MHIVILYIIYCFTATAAEENSIVIAHAGQNVELMCTVTPSGLKIAAWTIDRVVYTVERLHNGKLTGYSTNGNNLIIENIMMNDDRNDTEYECVTVPESHPTFVNIVDNSCPIILYVAGEYQYTFISIYICK